MLDLVVTGGTVVTPSGSVPADIGIADGVIVNVAEAGSLAEAAARVVDASGLIVVPGGVEPHVHTLWPHEHPDGTVSLYGEPEDVSRAALYGGTTTLLDYAVVGPGESIAAVIESKVTAWRTSYADFSLHLLIRGDVGDEVVAEIPDAVAAGYPSLKVFTTDMRPAMRGLMSHLGRAVEIMEVATKCGAMVNVHAEDDDLVMHGYRRAARERRADLTQMPVVHSARAEAIAVRRFIAAASTVEGAAVYFVHLTAEDSVQAVREARERGLPIYAETLHHSGVFTSDVYATPRGILYHTYPSLRSATDVRALWNGLAEGVISCLATDDNTTPESAKRQGGTVFDTPGGHAGVETRMMIAFTEGISRRGLSLDWFVRVTSSNAARLFGLYPQKGAIQPGSDADLCVWDPLADEVLRAESLHATDYSIWDGYRVKGVPRLTIKGGDIAVDHGKLMARPGVGIRVHRQIDPAVFRGPVL
jgi:dihydropyrimidinase